MPSIIENLQNRFPGWITFMLMSGKRALLPWSGHSKTRTICAKLGTPPTVMKGPFTGMRYVEFSCGSRLLPKLMGAYEMELHPYVQRMISLSPDLIIDVGTAEGYYAVGMARALPDAQVIGYDTSRWAWFLLQRMAELNGVSQRVEVCGFCTPEELNKRLIGTSRPAVICDCEGFEAELLDPLKSPNLARALILVELHDWISRDVSKLLRGRFEPTHDITSVTPTVRDSSAWRGNTVLSEEDLHYAISDERPQGNSWYFMTPRE